MNTAPAHSVPVEELLQQLESSADTGLSDEQILQLHERYGRNHLPDPDSQSPLSIFLNQFKSTIVIILLLAAFISFLYHHYLDVYIVVSIVVINAIVGFLQEFRAERSIQALKQMIVQQVTVKRNGRSISVSSHELVPGDIITISEGDKVPADARIISLKNLQVIESALTGESMPVEKNTSILTAETPLAERTNLVWMGTSVSRGEATAIVTDIGSSAALGEIATNLKDITEGEDHFKVKTNQLARQMGGVAIGTTVLMFLVGYFIRNFSFEEIFMFSVASLVSAIPEGLPVILTIVLALSASRMAKRHAIVRRLSATETLAVVDTIITDKTGTLTQNVMTVTAIRLPYQPPIGITYENKQALFNQEDQTPTTQHYPLQKLLDIAGMCHATKREFTANGTETITGDPTEIALVNLADHATKTPSYFQQTMHQVEDLPFNQEHRWRASVIQYEHQSESELCVVGSPETIMNQTTHILLPDHHTHAISNDHVKLVHNQIADLTSQGMRVIALAYRPLSSKETVTHDSVHDMVFVGLVGIVDPPRPETKAAIAAAKRAGIKVIMATGDHPTTAKAIGLDLGLLENIQERVLTEMDLSKLSDQEIEKELKYCSVFARMTPEAKLRLARILQHQGHVVAMTGDGVNDAPALKQADIGIGMGKNGTDVAREASDIILADDNFATIIAAIEEGRTQLRNVRRVSFFLITTNLAETLSLIIFLLLGLPIPLLPKQILWLNLVTAGVTDMSLATEPIHEDVLNAPPRNRKESILNKQLIPFLIIVTGTIIILSLAAFILFMPQGTAKARTVTFVVLSLTQLYNVLNLRSIKKSVFSIGIFSNRNVNLALIASMILLISVIYIPQLQTIFDFTPLSVGEFFGAVVVSSIILWASEIYKYFQYSASSSRS